MSPGQTREAGPGGPLWDGGQAGCVQRINMVGSCLQEHSRRSHTRSLTARVQPEREADCRAAAVNTWLPQVFTAARNQQTPLGSLGPGPDSPGLGLLQVVRSDG